jgi:two-component system, NtrC family, response regulator HydG
MASSISNPVGGGEIQELGGMRSGDPAMHRLFEEMRHLAAYEYLITTLIRGELGTGKELVANAIHRLRPRAHKPFVAFNCGAAAGRLEGLFGTLPDNADEREAAGAFGAARGGTLFLDNVGELPRLLQWHLVRAIDNRELEELDIQLVSSTRQDLAHELQNERILPGLFYQVGVTKLDIPPLRQRRCDILPLWDQITAAARGDRLESELSPEAQQKLLRHTWPGNVRELQNVAHRALVLGKGKVLGPEDIDFDLGEIAMA